MTVRECEDAIFKIRTQWADMVDASAEYYLIALLFTGNITHVIEFVLW